MSGDNDGILREADRYIESLFVPQDPVLQQALRDADSGGLPQINVSPAEGKLLYLLTKLANARRILEIGTLGGYSTIWMARALPADGRLISLEISERHAAVARGNIERAGLGARIEIRVGAALESLDKLAAAGEAPFDLVFIDADKETYPQYLERALRMVHSGSLILGDNALRRAVWQGATDPGAIGIRDFNAAVAREPRLEAVIVPIVRNSLDGLCIARVK